MSSNTSRITAPRFPESKQLSGEDSWREYKREVLLAVGSRGLTGYLDGTIVKPLPGVQGGTVYPPTATTTPIYSTTPFLEEWLARDAITTSIIVTNTTDPVGIGIDETKRSADIWKALVTK